MLKKSIILGIIAMGLMSASAMAQNNGPPAGNLIFNLAGQPLPQSHTTYTTSFVATDTITNLSFSLREDPAFFSLDNISLTTGGGPNLVVNGDFEQGVVGGTPVGFTFLNLYNAPFAGVVQGGCGVGGSNCFYDGSVGSYDSITQAIATTVGTTYTLTFSLNDNSGQATASAIAQNGLEGINLVVYAGALPTAVPEPASLALFGAGLFCAGLLRRRRD